MDAIAKSAYVHSGRVLARTHTRSPAPIPKSIKPRAISPTISPTSPNVTCRQTPSCLTATAGRSAYCSAARGSKSAIVRDPVDAYGYWPPAVLDTVVAASIFALLSPTAVPVALGAATPTEMLTRIDVSLSAKQGA